VQLIEDKVTNSNKNKPDKTDRAFHDWYRFVLSYPPQLVRKYINEFGLTSEDILLDPFCGTGTTLIEAQLQNIPSVGIEANNFVHFSSKVKTNWAIDSDVLMELSKLINENTLITLKKQGISDDSGFNSNPNIELLTLTNKQKKLVLKNSISPLPLHKSLVLLDEIDNYKQTEFYKYFILALGNSLVYQISNLRFGPEAGVGKIKTDTFVVQTWFAQMKKICSDIELSKKISFTKSESIFFDSRNLKEVLNGTKISAVITSPPYPNEKDYTRTTRLESVLLGFISNKRISGNSKNS